MPVLALQAWKCMALPRLLAAVHCVEVRHSKSKLAKASLQLLGSGVPLAATDNCVYLTTKFQQPRDDSMVSLPGQSEHVGKESGVCLFSSASSMLRCAMTLGLAWASIDAAISAGAHVL